jgi:hypothetical protein
MAMLKEYRITINGISTTAMLDEHDAKRLGGVEVKPTPAKPTVVPPAFAEKARTDVQNASRSAPNKAR